MNTESFIEDFFYIKLSYLKRILYLYLVLIIVLFIIYSVSNQREEIPIIAIFMINLISHARRNDIDKLKPYWKYVKKYRIKIIKDKKALKRVRMFAIVSFLGIYLTQLVLKYWYYYKWNI